MERPAIIVSRALWTQDKNEILRIRRLVFQEEQGVPREEDEDMYDELSYHLLAHDPQAETADNPVGTLRYRFTTELDIIKIERVSVLKASREHSIGSKLIEFAINTIGLSVKCFLVHAQRESIPFYEKLGFIKEGPEFLESNIIHFKMRRFT